MRLVRHRTDSPWRTCLRCRPRHRELSAQLNHLFAHGNLSKPEEGLHQRSLSADYHPWETLESLTLWNFWLGNEPVSELTELIERNFPLSDSIQCCNGCEATARLSITRRRPLMPRPRYPAADAERCEHDFHCQRAKDESHYPHQDGRALPTDHPQNRIRKKQ